MKKFLLKIVIFTGLFTLSFTCVFAFWFFIIGAQYLGSYQASLIDKTERLQSIDGKKIVLIGDSNVCFGVNSEEIEKEFGMPVIDMGLHGGLGNAFHENMVKLGVSEGDIVIICHSNFSDDDTPLDPVLAWVTIENHTEFLKLLRSRDILRLLRAYPSYFKKCFVYWIMGKGNIVSDGTCYSRNAFNEYGDIYKRFDDTYEFTEGSVVVPEINDTCINRLNDLNRYLNEQGATMLIAAYPIGYGQYTPPASEFDAFENELRDKVDCDVISHYTDYFIPYDMFYNTNLHLSEEGAELRTRQLIEDLHDWMNH